jgi:hypothetical protein
VLLSDEDFHPIVGAYFQAHFLYAFGVLDILVFPSLPIGVRYLMHFSSMTYRVGSRRLRAETLPHHRTCRFRHPAVEPGSDR